jgi:hypothetical protein
MRNNIFAKIVKKTKFKTPNVGRQLNKNVKTSLSFVEANVFSIFISVIIQNIAKEVF